MAMPVRKAGYKLVRDRSLNNSLRKVRIIEGQTSSKNRLMILTRINVIRGDVELDVVVVPDPNVSLVLDPHCIVAENFLLLYISLNSRQLQ